jgi:pimeloyl-ACP methyl ester carboxylesterase
MNVESFISFLSHSNWIFLAGLVLLLGGAFTVCFFDKPGHNRSTGSDRTPPR